MYYFKSLFKSNKGISLIEVIVVVAIMTILTGIAGIGLGTLSSKNATQCAKKMQIAIQRNRTDTMGKRNGRINIFKGSDGSIYISEEYNYDTSATPDTSERVKIGNSGVIVKANGTDIGSNIISIEFKRGDGSLYMATTDGVSNNALPITISKGSKTYTLNIDSLTGRVTLN